MASSMPCDFCPPGEVLTPALFLVGNLEDGEQQACCPYHFAQLGLSMALAVMPPEDIAQTLGPIFVDRTDKGDRAESRRARPKSAPVEESSESPPEGLEESAPATADG
ncbi:MAG TPA: hypothetical protein VNL71_21070 [Chloroflexota bacterium]|nr:hypothetical protein [Chloroflexota bacterium]